MHKAKAVSSPQPGVGGGGGWDVLWQRGERPGRAWKSARRGDVLAAMALRGTHKAKAVPQRQWNTQGKGGGVPACGAADPACAYDAGRARTASAAAAGRLSASCSGAAGRGVASASCSQTSCRRWWAFCSWASSRAARSRSCSAWLRSFAEIDQPGAFRFC